MPNREKSPVVAPRSSLVRGVPSSVRRVLERLTRAIQGNFDHLDNVIIQVNNRHNALDDNVQELTQHTNDVVADLEQRIFDLENP